MHIFCQILCICSILFQFLSCEFSFQGMGDSAAHSPISLMCWGSPHCQLYLGCIKRWVDSRVREVIVTEKGFLPGPALTGFCVCFIFLVCATLLQTFLSAVWNTLLFSDPRLNGIVQKREKFWPVSLLNTLPGNILNVSCGYYSIIRDLYVIVF